MNQSKILRPGRNLWTAGKAEASGVLVDAADYYRAFYQAASQAKRSSSACGFFFTT